MHKQQHRTQAMDSLQTGRLNNSVKIGMVHNNKYIHIMYIYKSKDYIKKNLPSNSLISLNATLGNIFYEHVLASVLLSATQ